MLTKEEELCTVVADTGAGADVEAGAEDEDEDEDEDEAEDEFKFESGPGGRISTGHKLHCELAWSQYTSTLNLRSPSAKRFEKHFWKAFSE